MNPIVLPDREPTTYHTATHTPVILIVEDDLLLSKMYSEKFTIDGFHAIVVHEGETALNFLKSNTPDCILLDLLIPKIDGLGVIERARKQSRNMPPIIALTNIAEIAQRDRAKELGVKEYLVKAMFTPEQVVMKVKDAILSYHEAHSPSS